MPNLLTIPGLVAAVPGLAHRHAPGRVAFNFSAVASLNVAASASLGVGLAVTALAANIQAALGINIAARVPCPICDARRSWRPARRWRARSRDLGRPGRAPRPDDPNQPGASRSSALASATRHSPGAWEVRCRPHRRRASARGRSRRRARRQPSRHAGPAARLRPARRDVAAAQLAAGARRSSTGSCATRRPPRVFADAAHRGVLPRRPSAAEPRRWASAPRTGRCGRPGAARLHQRHDRAAEGRAADRRRARGQRRDEPAHARAHRRRPRAHRAAAVPCRRHEHPDRRPR